MSSVARLRAKFSDSWILVAICTVAIQATSINLFGIKLSEFAALVSLPIILFAFNAKVGKISALLVAVMALVAICSIATNYNRSFFVPSSASIIKQPTYITASRLLSFVLCAVIIECTRRGIRKHSDFVARIIQIQASFALIFLVMWAFSRFGIKVPFVDAQNRLHGLYNEGGPFGLMCATMFCVAWVNGSPRWMKVVLLLCVFAAISKAGISLLIFAAAMQLFAATPKLMKPAILIVSVLAAFGGSFLIGKNYISSIKSAEAIMEYKMNDPNFVMGRIAGSTIAPKMFINNPVFGVGLGNYSLVRNDPLYRGAFPYIDEWDLPGLGGWVTMLAEGGVVGIFLTTLVFIFAYQKAVSSDKVLVILSMLPFVFGVQMYFAYPWVVLGLAREAGAQK